MICYIKGVEDVLMEGIFYAVLRLNGYMAVPERYSFLANRLRDLSIYLFSQ